MPSCNFSVDFSYICKQFQVIDTVLGEVGCSPSKFTVWREGEDVPGEVSWALLQQDLSVTVPLSCLSSLSSGMKFICVLMGQNQC